MLSPMGVGPPAFTPPEPGPAPPHLEVTQPTPSMETVEHTGKYPKLHLTPRPPLVCSIMCV